MEIFAFCYLIQNLSSERKNMKIIFKDASELNVQEVSESAGYLKVKIINQSREEILNIFKDESKTKLMKVEDSRETKVYEKYITFTSLTEYPGAIYEVCVAQEGRTVEELITDAMDQITQTQLALCEIYEMMS